MLRGKRALYKASAWRYVALIVSAPAPSPLPSHSIRRSARARRVSLRVLPGKGLEIVLPLWADAEIVPAVLHKHRLWIDRAIARMHVRQEHFRAVLPESISLKGGLERVHLRWQDGYAPDPSQNPPTPLPLHSKMHCPVERTLTLPKQYPTRPLTHENRTGILKEWLREEARLWLEPMLAQEADRLNLTYASMRVRFQKSRWGSCSVKGNINLNACLLFLPEHLARYILVHELCHTKAMNHSPAFWKLVFAADPNALAKDKALRHAWKYVPGWVVA